MQPREWLVLALLIGIPLAIAVVVTLWSIKQMAHSPKKPARERPRLSAEDLAALAAAGHADAADRADPTGSDPNRPAGAEPDARPPGASARGSSATIGENRGGGASM